MKKLIPLLAIVACISCQRDYACVCTSVSHDKDTLVDQIKTTKLGSKGYKKTCANYVNRNPDVTNCYVK